MQAKTAKVNVKASEYAFGQFHQHYMSAFAPIFLHQNKLKRKM
jgi:hypothetical protein